MPYTLAQLRRMTTERKNLQGPYELHGKADDPKFVDPVRGDFRLHAGSPASAIADDDQNMGAHADVLSEVGADKSYGLGRIPHLGQLNLNVVSSSSEHQVMDEATPFRPLTTGLASHAVDRAGATYWQVDTITDAKPELVLDLTENQTYLLTYITITKYHGPDRYFYKRFELFVDDGSGAWKPVTEPIEHPFSGYKGNNNGETWRLPESTMARRVKLRLISGHGDIIRIPEIRLYGHRAPR